MRARSLSLKKETLAELTTGDLAQVVGASGNSCQACVSGVCSDLRECISGARLCEDTVVCFTGTVQPTSLCQQ